MLLTTFVVVVVVVFVVVVVVVADSFVCVKADALVAFPIYLCPQWYVEGAAEHGAAEGRV